MSEVRLASTDEVIPHTPVPEVKEDTFSVTAIGSCRIIGPLRLMQQTEPVVLNQSGVYGYSHSSTEVRQHLTHLLNGSRPPLDLMPVLAPGVQAETKSSVRHKPSDFYIFELSSSKIISVEGHTVQLNYLNRHFRNFFSEIERTRAFWEHAKLADNSAMKNFLGNIPEYLALSSSDQRILRLIQMHLTSPEQLQLDIDAIRTAVPDHLFVTHFDATSIDGTILKARADYLKMVRAALTDCGAPWYDPSDCVATFGQQLALDDSDRSLSHFSHSFEQYLSRNWWMRFIEPVRQERRLDNELRLRIREKAIALTIDDNSSLIRT